MLLPFVRLLGNHCPSFPEAPTVQNCDSNKNELSNFKQNKIQLFAHSTAVKRITMLCTIM